MFHKRFFKVCFMRRLQFSYDKWVRNKCMSYIVCYCTIQKEFFLYFLRRSFGCLWTVIFLTQLIFHLSNFCWHISIHKYMFITALTLKLVNKISFTAFGIWTLGGSKVCYFLPFMFDSSLRCSTVCLTVLKCLPYCTFKINGFSVSSSVSETLFRLFAFLFTTNSMF